MTLSSKASLNILIINGSLGGNSGNTGIALERWTRTLSQRAQVKTLALSERIPPQDELRAMLDRADGFIFSSGTYWDSWGSPLQRFLELVTDLEGAEVWLGKPAACLITMHSVGGKEVLSRLQGVLSTLGLIIPPMSGMVLSLANLLASQASSDFADDFWQEPDLEILSHNLLEAMRLRKEHSPVWKSWNVDRKDPSRRWIHRDFG